MSTEFIVGTILTIIFGIPSIIQLFKKPPSRLIIAVDEIINLYADITKNLEGIEVTYRGDLVNENVYLIKFFLFYYGDKDITKDQVSRKLYVELQKNSNWKTFLLIDKTDDLDIEFTLEEKKLLFDFDILKNKDFVYLHALCVINEKKIKPSNIFNVGHRIANVGKVEILNINDISAKESIKPIYTVIGTWVFAFLVTYFFLSDPMRISDNNISDFKKEYYLKDKYYNQDSTRAVAENIAKRKTDSLNMLVNVRINTATVALARKTEEENLIQSRLDALYIQQQFDQWLRSYEKLKIVGNEKRKLSRQKDNLLLKLKKFKVDFVSIDTKLEPSFNQIMKKYNWLFFYFSDSISPVQINNIFSVSYRLIDKSDRSFAGWSFLMAAFLFIVASSVTIVYLKFRKVLDDLDRVRDRVKSKQD